VTLTDVPRRLVLVKGLGAMTSDAGPRWDPITVKIAPCATPPLGRVCTLPLAAFTTAVILGV
jgi:hypothetical protein